MNATPDLLQQRQAASQASGGTSLNHLYEFFERLIADRQLSGDLLDFGAGTGNLTRRLATSDRLTSVSGADLMPAPAQLDPRVRWHQADLNEPLPVEAAQFDVITACEVIEHLENPRAIAREWFRLLRPGGTIVLSTPNNESWRSIGALFLTGHFAYFNDANYPAHLTALVRQDLEHVLQECGFESIEVRYTDVGGIPKMPHRLWQSWFPSLGGVRFSDHVVVIARKPGQDRGRIVTRKRTLFLVSTTEVGGAEVVFRNIVKYADRSKIEPFVISLGFGRGDFPEQLRRAGIPVEVVRPARRMRYLATTYRRIQWIAEFLRRERIDVVISNGAHPHVYGSLAAWLAGRKAIWYVMMIPRKPLWRNAIVDQLGLLVPAERYFMASEACRDGFLRLFPRRASRVELVHHGFDPELFDVPSSGDAVRKEWGIAPDTPLVTLPARLQRWKGQRYFIQAIPKVVRRFPNAHFLVVGGTLFGLEAEFQTELKELVTELGVESNVTFTGLRTDIPAILAASDVFVHGSIHPEPGANAIIEAMAAGKAIVATDGGSSAELLNHGEAGALVPPRDPSAMADAIIAFLEDPEKRQRFGAIARARAHNHFTAQAMTRKVEACLESMDETP